MRSRRSFLSMLGIGIAASPLVAAIEPSPKFIPSLPLGSTRYPLLLEGKIMYVLNYQEEWITEYPDGRAVIRFTAPPASTDLA